MSLYCKPTKKSVVKSVLNESLFWHDECRLQARTQQLYQDCIVVKYIIIIMSTPLQAGEFTCGRTQCPELTCKRKIRSSQSCCDECDRKSLMLMTAFLVLDCHSANVVFRIRKCQDTGETVIGM